MAVMLDVRVASKRAAGRLVLQNLRFTLAPAEIVALVGPSGCGKTTLLRLIAGLDPAYEGTIDWPAGPPRIGTVFQEPRLLAWRTVRQNLAFAMPPDPSEPERLLRALGLADAQGRYPRALSLGMARRVALARALGVRPTLLILDEAFVSLDPPLAERCRAVVRDAWRAHGMAVLMVTHDLVEAASFAHRILVLSQDPASVIEERQGEAAPRAATPP